MELLRLAGYTEAEKLVISQRYLIPRQITENGLVPAVGFEQDKEIRRQGDRSWIFLLTSPKSGISMSI